MAKIARKIQKIFGGNNMDESGANPEGIIAQFGSLQAKDIKYSYDPEEIQKLRAYGQGWTGATMRNNIAPLQDMNALQFLFSYQLAYLMQSGIPEWHKDQEYQKGSLCRMDGVIYVSKGATANKGKNPKDADGSNWWNSYAPITIGEEKDRPTELICGCLHYDTKFLRWITWDGIEWTTVEGARGDIKHVWAKASQDAIERNPGWRLFDNAMDKGRVLAAAGNGNAAGKPEGETTQTLTTKEMPKHGHRLYVRASNGDWGNVRAINENNMFAPDGNNSGNKYVEKIKSSTGTLIPLIEEVGEGKAFSRMQPTLYVWTLIKGREIEQLS